MNSRTDAVDPLLVEGGSDHVHTDATIDNNNYGGNEHQPSDGRGSCDVEKVQMRVLEDGACGGQTPLPALRVVEAETGRGSQADRGTTTGTNGSGGGGDSSGGVVISRGVGTATVFSCIVNLSNTIIGAGMLGLPGAFAGTGYIVGSILMLLGAYFSSVGLYLLSLSAEKAGIPASFDTVARRAAASSSPGSSPSTSAATTRRGRGGGDHADGGGGSGVGNACSFTSCLVDSAVAIKCFGIATGHLVAAVDGLVGATSYFLRGRTDTWWTSMLSSRQFWTTVSLLVVLPFSFFRTLNALRFVSTFSIVFVVGLSIMVVTFAVGAWDPCGIGGTGIHNDYHHTGGVGREGLTDSSSSLDYYFSGSMSNSSATSSSCRGEIVPVTDITTTLQRIPLFIFAFTCQQNVFPIVNELKNRTKRRVTFVIVSAMGLALILYYIVGLGGYLTYGSNVYSDILRNYPSTSLPVTIMRVLIAGVVLGSYPLQLDPSRRSIMSLTSANQCFCCRPSSLCPRLLTARGRRRGSSGSAGVSPVSGERSDLNDNDRTLLDDTTSYDESLQQRLVRPQDITEVAAMTATAGESTGTTNNSTTPSSSSSQSINDEEDGGVRYTVITCLFLLFSYGIAMVVSDLGIVLAVVGATGSTLVSYVLPGALYLKLHCTSGSDGAEDQERHQWRRRGCCQQVGGCTTTLIVAWVQLVLGCLIIPISLFVVFRYEY